MRLQPLSHRCGPENIVWDYKKGEVICSKCGTIIDRIYSLDNVNSGTSDETRYSFVYKEKYYRWIKNKEKSYKKFKIILNKINKIKSKTNKIEINNDSFEYYIKTGKQIFILKNKNENNKIFNDEEILEIIEKFIKKDPILNSRTRRAKVAAALIIKSLTVNGKSNKKLANKVLKEISQKTGTSISQVRRLYNYIIDKDKNTK